MLTIEQRAQFDFVWRQGVLTGQKEGCVWGEQVSMKWPEGSRRRQADSHRIRVTAWPGHIGHQSTSGLDVRALSTCSLDVRAGDGLHLPAQGW